VNLRGGCSGLACVLAESLVVPDRLPNPIADGPTHEGASLGRLLTAGPVETRRERLQATAAPADEAACDHLGVQPGATLAQRTYRIVVGQRAIAAVTEWLFPGRLADAARRNTRNRADRPASTMAGPQ
jgi:chorismate-pyruvate lyase